MIGIGTLTKQPGLLLCGASVFISWATDDISLAASASPVVAALLTRHNMAT
jgi:hypothetical protein